jgi:hypothetical protein
MDYFACNILGARGGVMLPEELYYLFYAYFVEKSIEKRDLTFVEAGLWPGRYFLYVVDIKYVSRLR